MANPKRPPSREVRRLREELRRLMERWDAVIRRGAELERDLAQGLAQLRESRAAETLREIPVPMDYPRTRQDLTRPEIVALREQLVDILRKQVTV